MLAGLGSDAGFCQPSTLALVASPHRCVAVMRLLLAEGRRNGPAMPECDLWPLVAGRQSPCPLLPCPLVHAAPAAPAFGMLRNLRPVRQNMLRPFPSHNESAPERLLGVR